MCKSNKWSRSMAIRGIGVVLLLMLAFVSRPPTADAAMEFGFSKVDVTPDRPVRLSGYGSRNTPFEGVSQNGKAFTEKYGNRVGYRYSRAADSGIFWSNDSRKPIMEMVRELDLEPRADQLKRSRLMEAKFRQGEIER